MEYVHVKDALAGSGTVVPAGEGDGEIHETISALNSSGFDGFLSLEPHLASSGTVWLQRSCAVQPSRGGIQEPATPAGIPWS